MKGIWASLKDKKFRYGTLSTVMVLFAVAIFLLVNLVAGQFNLTHDLTQNKEFSLSQHSKDYLRDELNQPITIYALFRTGQEDLQLRQLLNEYETHSPHITVEVRDPMLYPTFINQFVSSDQPVDNGSLIVQSGTKHKFVPYGEMFTIDESFDFNSMQWVRRLVSIDYEPQISKAIQFVTLDDPPRIYHATGSNEIPLSEGFVRRLNIENYLYEEIDLVLNPLPDDCDILLLTMPRRDWSKDKADKILEFLQNDGRALFVMSYQAERFATVDSVLSAYGIAIGDYVVYESNPNRYYMYPFFIIPGFRASEITQPLIDNDYFTLFPLAAGIDELHLKRASTIIEPIVLTSASTFGKSNPEPASLNKEPEDIDGPFYLGVTVTDRNTRFVVYGCETILNESLDFEIGSNNWDLVVNSFHWLSEHVTLTHIPSKSPSRTIPLTMTQGQQYTLAAVSAIGLPLLFVVAGIVVWVRRRHS